MIGSPATWRVRGRAVSLIIVGLTCASPCEAQAPVAASVNGVNAALVAAPLLTFPNPTDSNSPLVWVGDQLLLFNSAGGQPARATGTRLEDVTPADLDGPALQFDDDLGSGRWLEAVIRDDQSGRLYGWYHNELPSDCPQGLRLWPRIGAALSDDDGVTWQDLGIILSPREGTVSCDTAHPVTNGGIGDFSVILDHNETEESHYLYFLFSSYGGDLEEQGISFARMLWVDRDRPLDRFSGESRALKWNGQDWNGAGIDGRSEAIFHDAQQVAWSSELNNGYWGPSVHWNTEIKKFIVLMSRSKGGNYDPDGVYQTSTTALDDPLSWAVPKRIIDGGQGWYPQVVGDPAILGTDKLAGARARYFNAGQSTAVIVFSETPPAPSAPSTARCGTSTGFAAIRPCDRREE